LVVLVILGVVLFSPAREAIFGKAVSVGANVVILSSCGTPAGGFNHERRSSGFPDLCTQSGGALQRGDNRRSNPEVINQTGCLAP